MIRPSSLTLARHCALSAKLSEQYPTRNENTDRGNVVDAQFTAAVRDGVVPTDPDARACAEYVFEVFLGYAATVQQRVELYDDDTGGLITAGTPDFVAVETPPLALKIVDLKKREQYAAGRLADPDDNDQLHAYAIAECQRTGAEEYQNILLLFGDGKVEALASRRYRKEDWGPILDRIKAVNSDPNPNPVGTSGDHCAKCYPRIHCPHWTLPAHELAVQTEAGEVSIGPFAPLTNNTLSPENAGRAVLAWTALGEAYDHAKEILTAYVDANGPIVVGDRQWGARMMPGRVSIDRDALERDGLTERYSKIGKPFQQVGWGKAKRIAK